jgi:ribosomal protein S18 acetylase RimI-like enzyme
MFHWLRNLLVHGRFRIPDLSHPLPECVIRPLEQRDHEVCLKIYLSNESEHFPTGYFEDFLELLRSEESLFLVAESAGEIRGFGGVAIKEDTAAVCLSYGMVDPAYHRCGYGTAILLARLSALPRPKHNWIVSLTTAGPAGTFYKRFGFVFYQRFKHRLGADLDMHFARLNIDGWLDCSKALTASSVKRNISVPVPSSEIPEVAL